MELRAYTAVKLMINKLVFIKLVQFDRPSKDASQWKRSLDSLHTFYMKFFTVNKYKLYKVFSNAFQLSVFSSETMAVVFF